MTGYRTIILGFLLAIGPVGLGYLAHVDWSFLPSWAAFAISGVIMMLMRYVTTTPVGISDK